MTFFGAVVEALALFDAAGLIAEVQFQTAAQHIAEFLAGMGRIFRHTPARFEGQQYGLHHIFLRVRNEPANMVFQLTVLLFKIVWFSEHQLLRIFLAEEIRGRSAEALQNVHQRQDGGRSQIALQLGDEALGELRAVRQFLLRQIVQDAQTPDFFTDLQEQPP